MLWRQGYLPNFAGRTGLHCYKLPCSFLFNTDNELLHLLLTAFPWSFSYHLLQLITAQIHHTLDCKEAMNSKHAGSDESWYISDNLRGMIYSHDEQLGLYNIYLYLSISIQWDYFWLQTMILVHRQQWRSQDKFHWPLYEKSCLNHRPKMEEW